MRRLRPTGSETIQPATGAVSAVLRQLRTLRGRSAQSVAEAMGLPLRTYQLFEAGHQRLHVELIFRFAGALEIDPYAILLAVMLDTPDLAVVCADNKLATALILELKAFQAQAGQSIASLRTTQLLSAFRAMFDGLAEQAATERDASRGLLARVAREDRDSPDEHSD